MDQTFNIVFLFELITLPTWKYILKIERHTYRWAKEQYDIKENFQKTYKNEIEHIFFATPFKFPPEFLQKYQGPSFWYLTGSKIQIVDVSQTSLTTRS